MTVGELIDRLREFDPTLPVRYHDYDSGQSVLPIELELCWRDPDYPDSPRAWAFPHEANTRYTEPFVLVCGSLAASKSNRSTT